MMNPARAPTRATGLARLAAFAPATGRDYAATRNSDHGPEDRSNVSVLSRYLRYRLLSEAEVVRAARDHHGPAADKFVQEVLWRTYWKGWLELRPTIWSRYTAERDVPQASGLAKAIATAEAGSTGIDGFDDWARELVDHGYLHNHARMWFASIWIFTLCLPWAAGAAFFERHLIDADPASNTLSWRWVAGLQTAGKTYLATADNIARYTNGHFAPQGLATRAIPLTEAPLPPATPLAPLPPHDPATPALLLVTPEDLTPEQLLPADAAIRAVHVVRGTADWPWGDQARAFLDAATADAGTRAAAYFGCRTSTATTLDTSTLIDAARTAGVTTVVTPYAPVGPVAAALTGLEPALAAAGLTLVRLRRTWDETLWPYATKGFFPFKKRVPALLPTLL